MNSFFKYNAKIEMCKMSKAEHYVNIVQNSLFENVIDI